MNDEVVVAQKNITMGPIYMIQRANPSFANSKPNEMQDQRIVNRVPQILREAKEYGIEQFACNGCCEDDWSRVS